MLLQLIANGLANASVTALVATGFALIYNTTRIFHLAHGAVFVVAAYTYYAVSRNLHWPVIPAILCALAVGMLTGAATEFTTYSHLFRKEATTTVNLLTSFGLYIVLINVVALLFGNEVRVFPASDRSVMSLGPVLFAEIQIEELVTAAIVLAALMFLLYRSNWGRLLRAVRDNPTLAISVGTDIRCMRYFAFVVGSGLVAVAAILSTVDVGIDPQRGLNALLVAAVAVIVGGIGTFGGPILGSVFVMLVQSAAVWCLSPKWSDAFTFSIVILFMLVRPAGLLSFRRRVEESID